MCKRNSPHKNEGRLGCVKETPCIEMKAARDVSDELPAQKGRQHGTCKRNTLHKNKTSTGGVRETPLIKMKPGWGV